ncbi:MAG: diaminopimelate epimerase [Candidatus Marinimicrobia bacterium]|nr:diaminopimelate epimerase [Candidatus Neomarinimicrobiota bacterium]
MIEFYKYVAAGNDFIIFNNWQGNLDLSREQIIDLCDRRFGIGSDGVLILTPDQQADFRMHYYNADGSRGEMCGNGARSLVQFAISHGKAGKTGTFRADDGHHEYELKQGQVAVQILVNDSLHPWDIPRPGCGFIDTGVPHLIIPVDDLAAEDIHRLGHAMDEHVSHPQGTNVNLVNRSDSRITVRTWERGVNVETLACGTGATAAAIYASRIWGVDWPIKLGFKGGELEVDLRGNQYWLKGPAELVFHGQIALPKRYSNLEK